MLILDFPEKSIFKCNTYLILLLKIALAFTGNNHYLNSSNNKLNVM